MVYALEAERCLVCQYFLLALPPDASIEEFSIVCPLLASLYVGQSIYRNGTSNANGLLFYGRIFPVKNSILFFRSLPENFSRRTNPVLVQSACKMKRRNLKSPLVTGKRREERNPKVRFTRA